MVDPSWLLRPLSMNGISAGSSAALSLKKSWRSVDLDAILVSEYVSLLFCIAIHNAYGECCSWLTDLFLIFQAAFLNLTEIEHNTFEIASSITSMSSHSSWWGLRIPRTPDTLRGVSRSYHVTSLFTSHYSHTLACFFAYSSTTYCFDGEVQCSERTSHPYFNPKDGDRLSLKTYSNVKIDIAVCLTCVPCTIHSLNTIEMHS